MNKISFLYIVFFVFISVGSFAAKEYIIGNGDVLKITVYDNPGLTTVARVSEEGVILFPLIGQVKVAELGVSQTAEKIASLLNDSFIVEPQVTVLIEKFRSRNVVIMGEVAKPGLYKLAGPVSFLELLSKAGGMTDRAGSEAIIKRKDSGEESERVITVDLRIFLKEGDTSFDVEIMDGDSIYVAEAGIFFVTGEVARPAAYPYKEGLTVVKAITLAGGFSEKAASGRVKIIRKIMGKERVIEKVMMDELVLPEDVIVVPESFF